MKVFISADIEGVSGVVSRTHTVKGESSDYTDMRRLMTAEVAAACRGALEAGADEIVVTDAHADSMNLIHEQLPEGVSLIRGGLMPGYMMEGLDASFDLVFFIGYHAMRGSLRGVLNHSYSGAAIYSLRLNGAPAGETAINAAWAGTFKAPVGLVSGDDVLCEEAGSVLPGAELVETKRAIGMLAAENRHPAQVREALCEAAGNAVKKVASLRPYVIEGPVEMEIEFVRTGQADAVSILKGAERKNGNTIVYRAGDFKDAFETMGVMLRLASTFKL